MREVNMESLAISPPEESKQFLDGNYLITFFSFVNPKNKRLNQTVIFWVGYYFCIYK